MADARTIDNLGNDVSVSYAIAQQRGLQDPDLSIDPSRFKAVAEVTVTSPYVVSDFDELFSTVSKKSSWANFSPPENFESNKKTRLFSFQLIPSIGSVEYQESVKEKVLNFKSKKKEGQNKMEILEEQKEHKKILDLLEEFLEKDKIHINISAKRGEYQRG